MKQAESFIEGPILASLLLLLGQKLGKGRSEEGVQVLGSAIALFAAVALLPTGAMVWAASPMSRLMQAPAEAFEQTVTYRRLAVTAQKL